MIRDLGKFIREKVFINYTAKQWGIPIDEIDQTVINRVPVIIGYDDTYFRDRFQMMPTFGYTSLITNILNHKDIDIKVNINVKQLLSINLDINEIFFINQKFNGIVFFTGAIDEFLDYKFGVLPYRSLNLVFEDHDVEYYQSNSVINYPNEESFTRITEFKYLMPALPSTGKGTTILKEYPVEYKSNGIYEPFYPIVNDKSTEIYAKYVLAIKKIRNLHLCGRLAEYKYYNMDSVILNALILSDGTK
ncbi:MAG: UDP-galactopyranose mutase [Tannerella sp.]|jgi:UDP-galactopyranose mutase|nr:UDP-galactopyranose mutase [Tannerella sp.]